MTLTRKLFLFLLLPILWMGAQIDSKERRTALHGTVPESFEPYVAPLINYTSDVLDVTYFAVDHTKHSIFLWGKVLLLIGAPIVKLCMWNFSSIIYLIHLTLPYLKAFWKELVQIGIQLQPYLIRFWNIILEGLEWTYPYLIQLKDFLIYHGSIGLNILIHYGSKGLDILIHYGSKGLDILMENGNHLFNLFIQQDQSYILMELSIIPILGVLWLIQRYIKKHYKKVSQQIFRYCHKQYMIFKIFIRGKYMEIKLYIKTKSLLAAAFFPHLLLFSPVALGIYFLPTLLARISQGYILMFVSLIFPIINTIYSIEKDSEFSIKHSLVYWVVFSLVAATHSLVGYIPFASTLLESIPYLQEFGFLFFIWLQLPWTDGSSILYKYVIPLVNSALQSVTVPGFLLSFQKSLQNPYLSVFINAVVPDPYRSNVMAVLLQGGTLVFGLPFFFTADYFTGLACIIIGILVPYYSSVTTLTQSQNSMDKNVFLWWLKYWIIFFCFSYLHDAITMALNLSHFPYWYQLKLLGIYYLQLPLTAGANQLYGRIVHPISKRILGDKNEIKNGTFIDDKIKQD